MTSKLFVTFIFLLLISPWVSGQPQSQFSNKTLQYRLYLSGFKLLDSNKVELSKYTIEVILPDSVKSKIKKFKYADWVALLLNKNTDWAANLCLYDIYSRDATVTHHFIQKRSVWIRCCKADDIIYWKKNLPH